MVGRYSSASIPMTNSNLFADEDENDIAGSREGHAKRRPTSLDIE